MSVYSVNVYPSGITIKTGKWYYGAYAIVNDSSNCNTGVKWYSNNTSVATVNALSGYIYAKNPGTTRIYAQSTVDSSKKDYITVTVTNGEYDICYVNVTQDILVTSVTVNPSSKTMNIGNFAYLYETVCPTNAINKCVKWSSNKTSVATVNPDTGLVIAQGAGTATITATAQDGSNKKGYCTITVNAPVAVIGVDVCPTSLTMNVGDADYLCETVYPSNATN